jgi:hypothetical protein
MRWCLPWSRRIKPAGFCIIGGEPLLHPELIKIIQRAKRIWYDSKIELWTNGTLPKRLTPELLAAIKTIDKVYISVKPYKEIVGRDYNEEINDSIKIYNDNGIKVHIRNLNFIKLPWINNILPNNTAEEGFKACCNAKCVQPIYNGKLYRCLTLEIFQKMYRIGKLDWAGVMDYKPLEPNCSDEEIRRLIEHKHCCEQCRFCPSQYYISHNEIATYKTGYSVIG